MTGVDIIGTLLEANEAIVAMFGEAIREDRLPDGTPFPSLLLRTVSSIDRQTLTRGDTVRRIDRVSVLVRGENVRDRKEGIRLVRLCCAGLTGEVGGGRSVAIATAGLGPSLTGPGNSFEQTQDFRVSFDADD